MIVRSDDSPIEQVVFQTEWLPFGLLRLNERREIVGVSSSFLKHFEADPSGQILDDLISSSDRTGQTAYLHQLSEFHDSLDVIVTITTQKKRELCRLRLLQDGSHEWVAILEPMTEEDSIRALLTENKRYKSVVQNATEGIAILDAEGRVIECNTAFVEVTDLRSKHGVLLTAPSLQGQLFADVAGAGHDPILEALHAEEARSRRFIGRLILGEQSIAATLTPIFVTRDVFGGCVLVVRDVTGEEEIDRLRLASARSLGQAEVATSVLHNVGNALNSLFVGREYVADLVRSTRVDALVAAIEKLDCEDPSLFLQSELGQKCLPCLQSLAKHLAARQEQVLDELKCLESHLGHIQAIVAKQQRYATSLTVVEACHPTELFEYAMEMAKLDDTDCREIRVVRKFEDIGERGFERHRVIEILVNLLTNAKDAALDQGGEQIIQVSTSLAEDGTLCFTVEDSGVGIHSDDLPRIFQHGFTRKRDGHGFGLHSCACIAAELNGKLTCESDGPGRGARFQLSIPSRAIESHV